MKFVYGQMEHIISFEPGYAAELVIENKRMFYELVTGVTSQTDGLRGGAVLSVKDRPVEMSKYADITVQFAPFEINKKSLLTKLHAYLEQKAVSPEIFSDTCDLLTRAEILGNRLSDDLPFEVEFKKMSIGPIIRAIAPEFVEYDKSPLEKILDYMEIVRDLDRDRLFIMVNMRTYFSDEDMESFIESVCLHDFKVLLLESSSLSLLKNTKRYTVDSDLCEF